MEPDIDKIEAYVSGEMTGAERQAFEAEMAGNSALAEEVDAFRLAREAVELSISDGLRSQFQEWQETGTNTTKSEEARVVTMTPRRNLRRILAIAASVLLILTAGSFWYANNQFSADNLAVGYYQDIPMDLYVRGGANSMADAVAAMQAGNFTEAETFFRSIEAGNDQYFDAQYYLAHSLYLQKEYSASIETLNALKEASNNNLKEDGAWLKVLNYLELGQTKDETFQNILSGMLEDEGHTHHSDAVELKNKLNSFWYKLAN